MLEKVIDGMALKRQGPLEPCFPADVAARQESRCAVDNNILRMHDAERQNEYALDHYVKSRQLARMRQPQSRGEVACIVDVSTLRPGVREFLPE